MNNINIDTLDIDLPPWSKNVSKFAKKVLKEIDRNNWEFSIMFCGDKTMTGLNSKYRSKKEPTDILSFELGQTVPAGKDGKKTVYLPGDIVISLETLGKNAKKFKITQDEELRRLIIHGILHLNGMNHKTNDNQEPMLTFQEEILARLGKERIMGVTA